MAHYLIGKFLHEVLIPKRCLEDAVHSLEEQDKKEFLDFVKKMLAWVPERDSPRQLMRDRFINPDSIAERASV